MSKQSPEKVYVSVISLGEVLFGIRRLPIGSRRARLATWYKDVLTPFYAERILSVDETVADVWAGVRVSRRSTPSPTDSLIAATALAHDLTMATRNERHFTGLGVRVVNPWTP